MTGLKPARGVKRMVLKRIISALLTRDKKVIVPINCNVPEHDPEFIEIGMLGSPKKAE
jgi:hypothetical protein